MESFPSLTISLTLEAGARRAEETPCMCLTAPLPTLTPGSDKVIEADDKTILVSSAGSDLLPVISPASGRLSLVIQSVKVGEGVRVDRPQVEDHQREGSVSSRTS